MTFPTIHMNGTSRDRLYEEICEVAGTVRAAIRAMESASPNGRDYYPQGPAALPAAAAEHRSRIERLSSVLAELQEIAEHIVDVGG